MLTSLLRDNGRDLGSLLDTSLGLFKDRGVVEPSLRLFWFSLLNHTVFTLCVLSMVYSDQLHVGMLLLSILFFVLLPYSFFYRTRMKACQAWMVYGAVTGRAVSFQQALDRTDHQRWTLRLFSFIELLFSTRSREDSREKSGLLPFIARLFFSALETVYDIAEDYLLPATVVEQKPIPETIGKLQQLKSNIPATLSGAFGFDLFGNAISSITFLIHFSIWASGVGIGFMLAPLVPQALTTEVPLREIQSLSFVPGQVFLAPVILSFVLSSFFGRVLSIMVGSLKNVYFTVFYVSINKSAEIKAELRGPLTEFLVGQRG